MQEIFDGLIAIMTTYGYAGYALTGIVILTYVGLKLLKYSVSKAT